MLITKPLRNVEKGVLTVTPGAKTPTTKEPNVILALSKKKSDTTLDLSFISIKNKFTTVESDCQGAKGQEILLSRQERSSGNILNPNFAIAKFGLKENCLLACLLLAYCVRRTAYCAIRKTHDAKRATHNAIGGKWKKGELML